MWFGLLLAALAQDFDQPRIVRLDSGLRAVIVEDRTTRAVSVQLWYRAGSSLDDPANPGLCHIARTFLEHRDNLAAKIRAAGGRFESETLRDACYFATIVPPELLETVLTLEAERMQPIDEPQIDMVSAIQNAVRSGRGTQAGQFVRNRSSGDDGRSQSFETLLAAAFPDDPYRRSPGYVAKSNAKLSAAELTDFLNRWFVPASATLLIIGDIDALSTEDLVRRRFANLKWREPSRRAFAPRPEKIEVLLDDRSAERDGVDFAWVTLPWGYFENAAIDVLMHTLCNPVDGALARQLTLAGFNRPRFTRFAWAERGLLILSLDVPPARRADAQRIIRDALQNAQNELPSETQLNRAVTAAKRHVASNRTTFRRRALQLAAHEIVGRDMLLAEMETLRYERVAAGDVQIAAAMLSRSRRVVVRRTAGDPLPTERLTSSRAKRLTGEQGLTMFSALITDTTQVAIAERPKAAAWTVERLNERVTLALRSVPGAAGAIVTTTVDVPLEQATAAAHAMMRGTAACNGLCLRDYLSYHGIKLAPLSGGGRCGLIAEGPSSRVEQMIEWQAKLMQSPSTTDLSLREAMLAARNEQSRLIASPSDLADYLANRVLASLRPQIPAFDGQFDRLRETLTRIPAAASVRVDVSGRFDRDMVLAEVRRAWPAANLEQAAAAPRSKKLQRDDGVSIFWHAGATSDVQVRVIVQGVTTDAQTLEIAAIARLIGAPDEQMTDIDGRNRWLWHCRAIGSTTLIASTKTTTATAAEELRAILGRLGAIRDGAVAPERQRLATRLAASDRVTVERNHHDRFAENAANANLVWKISIIVVGGDASLAQPLQSIGDLHRLPPP